MVTYFSIDSGCEREKENKILIKWLYLHGGALEAPLKSLAVADSHFKSVPKSLV